MAKKSEKPTKHAKPVKPRKPRKSKKAKKSGFDFTEWACDPTNHSRRRSGCQTCRNPEIVEIIQTVLKMVVGGKSKATLAGLHQMLVENYDYDLTITAMRGHVIKCETELFKRYQKL